MMTQLISIIIPFFNEEENVAPLIEELIYELKNSGLKFEVLCINDGSTDNTVFELKKQREKYPEVRIINHNRNYGKSAAYATGFFYSQGNVIIAIDGDMQCDPRDIPLLLNKLKEADAVFGVRKSRKDSFFKKIQSKIGNMIRKLILRDDITDMGCPIKAIKKEVLKEIPIFKGMHWFLPTILKFQGYKVIECEVRHRPRLYGKSKYGIWNRIVFFFDCLGMLWWKKRCLPKDRIKQEL